MIINEALQWAKEELRYACERPLFEAEVLLAYHLDKDRTYLVTHDGDEVCRFNKFEELIARRKAHEPMEYIIGRSSFYDLELTVSSAVLIPRSETEILVDIASELIKENGYTRIAEIGIGSGAISISLARKFPHIKIIASDISKDALVVAKENIEEFGLEGQIELLHTSLLDGIDYNSLEMIVSNPPYIAKNKPLAPNVAEYEPHTALYSQEQGDELLKEIILLTKVRKIKHLVCEMGYDQKESISNFAKEAEVKSIEFYQDYAGLDRGFVIGGYS
ncbi:MAG: peptide chain release factor N(5)-glutamine methyltransferase [Sulfurovum sp.]|nr:peptide chain release factor N(5)-glutamine methyltransferase [Sulfurovum sp.]